MEAANRCVRLLGVLLAWIFFLRLSGISAWGEGEEEEAPELKTNPNATVITSEAFQLDMGKHEGLFTGNVLLMGNNLRMKSSDLTVYFDASGKQVERLVARGNVEIEQGNRVARASQAEYIVSEDKLVLTGSPELVQDKNRLTGSTITIYRSSDRMEVDGRSRVVLSDVGAKKEDH
ncbi:LptA/OstA family protein [Candidatus Methylacidithermus pantelleriae]|uniref:OstA-like_N domain-containing protein n=1 Tax=Candidatus Methylacidithermus pantelleriae TaxID=2744239 RepID=A0A8J2FS64_9BACT|nr:LptA/OstA family protein [Candidatus Methylacidithermus pantelleriae]CAF0694000.1 OstA-like_N domain-containing protein [Candidatus Methylacidithermus pantelleriae]